MDADQPSRLPRPRSVAIIFCVWVAFSLVVALVSASIHGETSAQLNAVLGASVVPAACWTTFSFIVERWQRRAQAAPVVRLARCCGTYGMLVVVSLVDAASLRLAAELLSGRPFPISLPATAVYYVDFDIVRYVAIVAAMEALRLRHADSIGDGWHRESSSCSRARGWTISKRSFSPTFSSTRSERFVGACRAVRRLHAARVARQPRRYTVRHASCRLLNEVPLRYRARGHRALPGYQRLRFADWLTIEYSHHSPLALECLVPRFVLQPLVENAIHHGLSGRHAPARIRLRSRGSMTTRSSSPLRDNGVGLAAGAGVCVRPPYRPDERARSSRDPLWGRASPSSLRR